MAMLTKLQRRWALNTKFDVVLVLIVFTLAGTSISFIRKPVLGFFGIVWGEGLMVNMHFFELDLFYVSMYVLCISSLYQVLFMTYGAILGQWKFAWAFEKKMFKRLLKIQAAAIIIAGVIKLIDFL